MTGRVWPEIGGKWAVMDAEHGLEGEASPLFRPAAG